VGLLRGHHRFRGHKVVTVAGARNPDVLVAAGLARAARLYACADQTPANIATVLAAGQVERRVRAPLEVVHAPVVDPELGDALRGGRWRPGMEVDFFSLDGVAASDEAGFQNFEARLTDWLRKLSVTTLPGPAVRSPRPQRPERLGRVGQVVRFAEVLRQPFGTGLLDHHQRQVQRMHVAHLVGQVRPLLAALQNDQIGFHQLVADLRADVLVDDPGSRPGWTKRGRRQAGSTKPPRVQVRAAVYPADYPQ
jgi:hypothetical protein